MENFSLNVVRHIVEDKGNEADFIIHVGDVLNNSCVSEFDEAMDSLTGKSERAVYVVPGNHDGFYLGMTSPTTIQSASALLGVLNELGGWAQACTPACDKKRKDGLPTCGGENETADTTSNADRHDFLTFDRAENLAGMNGYAVNVLDKYSYVLAYLKKLGITDHCASSKKDAPGKELCPAQNGLSDTSFVVRCAQPASHEHSAGDLLDGSREPPNKGNAADPQ